MADVAKNFYRGSPSSGTHTLANTVPAGKKWIIRHIHIINITAASANVMVGVGTTATTTNRFADYTLAQTASYDWSGFMVLDAAETLYVYASLGNSVFFISGVEVDV